ncbi:MAG: hypothetical protein ACF788_13695, partial [Novipirellula sp. JB048]
MLKRTFLFNLIALVLCASPGLGQAERGQSASSAAPTPRDTQRGDELVAEYFRGQTAQIAAETFADIHT